MEICIELYYKVETKLLYLAYKFQQKTFNKIISQIQILLFYFLFYFSLTYIFQFFFFGFFLSEKVIFVS